MKAWIDTLTIVFNAYLITVPTGTDSDRDHTAVAVMMLHRIPDQIHQNEFEHRFVDPDCFRPGIDPDTETIRHVDNLSQGLHGFGHGNRLDGVGKATDPGIAEHGIEQSLHPLNALA